MNNITKRIELSSDEYENISREEETSVFIPVVMKPVSGDRLLLERKEGEGTLQSAAIEVVVEAVRNTEVIRCGEASVEVLFRRCVGRPAAVFDGP